MTDKSLATQPYEIVSVRRAEPPPGGKGSNWYRYVIAFEGTNTIHGCRQGGLKAVTSAVEEIVAQLNVRHLSKTGRVHLMLTKKSHNGARFALRLSSASILLLTKDQSPVKCACSIRSCVLGAQPSNRNNKSMLNVFTLTEPNKIPPKPLFSLL